MLAAPRSDLLAIKRIRAQKSGGFVDVHRTCHQPWKGAQGRRLLICKGVEKWPCQNGSAGGAGIELSRRLLQAKEASFNSSIPFERAILTATRH
jgi:hypothetical protein